jgi:hypothetical protein
MLEKKYTYNTIITLLLLKSQAILRYSFQDLTEKKVLFKRYVKRPLLDREHRYKIIECGGDKNPSYSPGYQHTVARSIIISVPVKSH